MTILEFSYLFGDVIPVISTVGVALGVYYYKHLNAVNKGLVIYLGIMLFTDLLSRILGELYRNNHIVLHIYSLLELGFFAYLYTRLLLVTKQKLFMALGAAGILYIFTEITLYFIINKINFAQYQPYAKVVCNFIIILMALAFYLQRINLPAETNWPYFKLNTAILCFFTLTTIVFLPFNFLINSASDVKFYFWFFNSVVIVCFEVYLIALIVKNGKAAMPNNISS